MICTSQKLVTSIYNSVEELPEKVWDFLSLSGSLYFSKSYIQSLKIHHHDVIFLFAVCCNEQGDVVGFSHIQVFDFFVDDLKNDWQNITKRMASIARKLKIIPRKKPLKILNCGVPYVSGNHGVYLHPDGDKQKVLRSMVRSVHRFAFQNFVQAPIDIFMVKDFTKEDVSYSNELIGLGYYAFNVEPNMVLSVQENWKNLDHYLDALKTKFRVKAKKALELSKVLEINSLYQKDIGVVLNEMKSLYSQVASKAGFNLVDFNLDTYVELLKTIPNHYFINTYRYQNQLVGFSSGIVNSDSLDAHFVGIDYKKNKKMAIYQRMLYDYISMGIEKKVSRINFGRTASEIKSSVGATPEHLTLYIRHKKNITNKFLQLFLYRIQPSEFRQKFPFKTKQSS